jgi:hypothetical protein
MPDRSLAALIGFVVGAIAWLGQGSLSGSLRFSDAIVAGVIAWAVAIFVIGRIRRRPPGA